MADGSFVTAKDDKKRSGVAAFLLKLLREKRLGTIGAVITLVFLFITIFANYLAPYGSNDSMIQNRLSPPSHTFLLGTDNLGRDVLSHVIYGARISMIVGLGSALLSTLISVVIGAVSGYFSGKVDVLVQRFVDAVMCFPVLILCMVLISVLKPGMWQVIVVFGVTWGISGSRIIRSSTLSVRENMYVRAAESIGCSPLRTLMKYILPNITAPAIVLFTTRVPNAIIVEASLSFLGYGLPPPAPSWGAMLSGSGRVFMYDAPWMALWPGVAIAVIVYGINMFGDAVRDILDPRLRGGGGRYGGGKAVKAADNNEPDTTEGSASNV